MILPDISFSGKMDLAAFRHLSITEAKSIVTPENCLQAKEIVRENLNERDPLQRVLKIRPDLFDQVWEKGYAETFKRTVHFEVFRIHYINGLFVIRYTNMDRIAIYEMVSGDRIRKRFSESFIEQIAG